MQKIITNPQPQDHTQTYGQYCLSILTPEYREWVQDSNSDWKNNRLNYLRGKDDEQSDIEMIAILEIIDLEIQQES